MENRTADPPDKPRKWPILLTTAADVFKASIKPAVVAVLVVAAVWCAGRLLEALNGNAVFDAMSSFWLGAVVGLLLILWLAGRAIECFDTVKCASSRKALVFAWTAFFTLVAIVIWRIEGFQVSVSGLLAAVAGSPEASHKATFLMMKYHPANPMLALNLGVQALSGVEWDLASLAPYVWDWNTLLFLSVWNFALGLLLVTRPGMVFIKAIHLLLATVGLTTLIFLKSKSLVTTEYLIALQVAALLMLLLQMLMTYALLRGKAAEDFKVFPEGETKRLDDRKSPQKQPKLDHRRLPPSAVAITLALFFVLPILADLGHQVKLAAYTRQFVDNENPAAHSNSDVRVAEATLSIRSGPSLGDDVLGVLPKGARIHVRDAQFGWVHIGHNHWVSEKFLRPLNKGERASRIAITKMPS